jgi:hypothetical protein
MNHQVRPAALNARTYVIDNYIITLISDQVVTVDIARAPNPLRELGLFFAKINIEEIEISSLAAEEIPESLRNIPKLIEQLRVQPEDFDEHGKTVHAASRP